MRQIDADAMKERIVDYTGDGKADVIREWIDEQPTVNGWISVYDATPDKDGVYLTWHGQSPMIQAFGLTGANLIGMSTWIDQKGGWWSIEMNRPIVGITYWQPLPEPPTVDSVTVVRCGMCKHWTACESEENDCNCYGVCEQINRLTIYDWFCADGEVK